MLSHFSCLARGRAGPLRPASFRGVATWVDRECAHADAITAGLRVLAGSSSPVDRLAAVRAVKGALMAASAEAAEAEADTLGGGSAEPLFLALHERTSRALALHRDILQDAAAAAAAAAAATTTTAPARASSGEGGDEDEDALDGLAVEAPLYPASLTFATTPFETVAAILQLLEDRYGLSDVNGLGDNAAAVGHGAWLDLGSGDGGPTLAAALLRPWGACGGLEVQGALHASAVALAEAYARAREAADAGPWREDAAPALAFAHADFRSYFRDASGEAGPAAAQGHKGAVAGGPAGLAGVRVLFLHATCFDDGLMRYAAGLVSNLPAGCLVVSATKPVPSPLLQLLDTRAVRASIKCACYISAITHANTHTHIHTDSTLAHTHARTHDV